MRKSRREDVLLVASLVRPLVLIPFRWVRDLNFERQIYVFRQRTLFASAAAENSTFILILMRGVRRRLERGAP